MNSRIDEALELHQLSSDLEEDGDLAAAERHCRQALAIFEQEDGPDSADVANLACSLGSILEKRGDYAGAAEQARRSIAIIEPLLPAFDGPDGSLILLHALGLLGTALRQQGAYTEALIPLERAIFLAESLSELPDEVAIAWNNLGMDCKYAGWFDRGADAYEKAMHWASQTEDQLLIATILHNIGGLEHARERFDKAEEPARRAWEIRRTALGNDHPHAIADAVAYAAVLDGLDRWNESRPIYERALTLYEQLYGPAHFEVAATLHNLAALEDASGNRQRAGEIAHRALQLKRELLGADHPDTALTALILSSIRFQQGDATAARDLAQQAEATFVRTLSVDHPHLAQARFLLSRIG